MNAARAALALALLVGCDLGLGSDPLTGAGEPPPCLAGHVRTSAGCLVAVAVADIDGDAGEWNDRAELPLDAVCSQASCAGLLPGFAQATTYAVDDEPGYLFVRVALAEGAAPDPSDPDLRWVLAFGPPPGSLNRVTDRIVAGGGGAAVYTRAGAALALDPFGMSFFAFAWTADGFEAWVAINFLPALRTVQVVPVAERRDGDQWLPVAAVAGAQLCVRASPAGRDPCEVAP